ncbi:hypothetical protein MMC16_002782 [Acarospora aff. strigata]|nr:hypothetical protein [Acarospora aff. strigata]
MRPRRRGGVASALNAMFGLRDEVIVVSDPVGASGSQSSANQPATPALDAKAPVLDAKAQALARALKKLPAYVGPCFHAGYFPDELLAPYVAGLVLLESAFVSASIDPVAFGNLRYRILSRKAKPLWSFSATPQEREVVFTAGTAFTVLAHDIVDEVHWVVLAEVATQGQHSQITREEQAFLEESRAGYPTWSNPPADQASTLAPTKQFFPIGIHPNATAHLAPPPEQAW